MSLFGSLMGDFEDDPMNIFGQHMRSMRQMNSMMNSIFSDPFAMMNPFDAIGGVGGAPSALTGGYPHQPHHQQQMQQHRHLAGGGGLMMPFGGFPSMPNMNRLLNCDLPEDGTSFSSSRVVTMTQGPDGRPLVYQASSSTKTGPGGIRETQKTVQDSRTGLKKMAIGHHIGERGHIIEREQNVQSGHQEERQDFINLEEEEAEDFDREFTQRSRHVVGGIGELGNGSSRRQQQQNSLPAIMPAQSSNASSDASANTATTTNTTTTASSMSSSSSPSTNQQPHEQHTTSSSTTSPTHLPNYRRGTRNHIATSRRPLRTPTSSPLTLPPHIMNVGFHVMSPRTSIHPHPYNIPPSSSRRSRMKGKTSQQQQQQQQQHQTNQRHHVQIEELPDDYDESADGNVRTASPIVEENVRRK